MMFVLGYFALLHSQTCKSADENSSMTPSQNGQHNEKTQIEKHCNAAKRLYVQSKYQQHSVHIFDLLAHMAEFQLGLGD